MAKTVLCRFGRSVPLLGVAASVVIAAVAALTVAAPAAAAPEQIDDGFSVAELAWAQPEVDVRPGPATATLEWTIVNDDPEATSVSGEVSVRPADARSRAYIGEAYEIAYSMAACCADAVFTGGSAQRSTYRATVPLPQYAGRPTVSWVVTRITAAEDDEDPEVFAGAELADFGAVLRAKTLVDTAPPVFDRMNFTEGPENPYLYVNGTAAWKLLSIGVRDEQSGFWKGAIEFTGPTGQTVRSAFELARNYESDVSQCDDSSAQPTGHIWCTAVIRLPADAAEGAWHMSSITLTDGAGNRTTTRSPQAPTLVVTGNRTLRVTGVAADPNGVDNWRADRETTLTVSVTGAQGGIEYAEVVTDWIGGCFGSGTTPTVNPDGTLAIPVMMESHVNACTVTGLVLRDRAGNVAAYGRHVHGPELNIPLTRTPDPTPPQIGSAALNRDTVPLADVSTAGVTLTVTTDTEGSPLELAFVSLYDAGGAMVCGATAARYPDERGVVVMRVYIRPDIAPGVYTVGLDLRDTLDRTVSYGAPDGLPMPGGPLTLTITP